MSGEEKPDTDTVNNFGAQFYENEMIVSFLGESFQPGGEQLTQHLGEVMELKKGMKVLDVACGIGTSAITLAKWFEVEVAGIDPSDANLEKAKAKAKRTGFDDRVSFTKSDSEKIIFEDNKFDAVITELALCTSPDKKAAVSEMYRVLKKDGRIGVTDVLLNGELPPELENIVSMLISISGANSVDGYKKLLRDGGFRSIVYEDHSHTLDELIKKGQKMLMGWNLIEKIFKLDLQKMLGITSEEARELLIKAMDEVKKGTIGYGLFVGTK